MTLILPRAYLDFYEFIDSMSHIHAWFYLAIPFVEASFFHMQKWIQNKDY